MSQTTQTADDDDHVEVSADDGSGDDEDELSFSGSIKGLLGISITAVGGAAALYAFGIVIAIAVLAAAVLVAGMYFRYKRKLKLS